MIKPTVGRIVLYHPPRIVLRHPPFAADSGTKECTYAAIICHVWSDTCVNLAVFDNNGVASSQTSVFLYQGDTERPSSQYCEWMPYQKAVAEGMIPPMIPPVLHVKPEAQSTLEWKVWCDGQFQAPSGDTALPSGDK